MRRTVAAAAVMAALALMTVRAQDAKATLDAATAAMGSPNNVNYTATGTMAAFGQAYAPGTAWPTFKVTKYDATIDLNTDAMRVEIERTNPPAPVRGGGGLPLFGAGNPQKLLQFLNNRTAWNVNLAAAPGVDPNQPQQAGLQQRLLDFWTGPHAVLLAADANKATASGRTLSFKMFNTPVTVTLAMDNTVAKVEYQTDNPVLGDTTTETTYTLYKTFGRAKFPMHITTKQGGMTILDLTVTDVKMNGIINAMAVPASVQQSFAANPAPRAGQPPPAPMVTTTKVADGVYYLTGGTHHSMAVEFADFSVLFEVPQTEERALAVIDATKKAIPNKPIRYVVNTHHHFDHLGGIRAAMSQGLTILTQAANKPYYEKIATMPHTIAPDALAKAPKAPMIEAILEKKVITDATRTLEIYHVPSMHASTLLVGYLPKEKILYEVDVFNAPAANAPAPAAGNVNPATAEFYKTLATLKIAPDQILPGHGPGVATVAQLKTFAGSGSAATN